MHGHDHDHHHPHTHEHEHTHEHANGQAHSHGHTHEHDHAHDHESGQHSHGHDQIHADTAAHSHDHDNLMKSREEVAAFLSYTLSHNAHHEEDLAGLVHSLQHLQMDREAGEIGLYIEEIKQANKRLETVLAALK